MTVETDEQRTFSLTATTLVPSTVKTQASFASVMALLIVAITSYSCLNFGFLHEDFVLLETIGHHISSINALISDPVMAQHGLGPLAAITLLVENVLWGTQAAWYHAVNMVLYMCCALLVTQIAIQISGTRGNRLSAAPAIWVAILFSLYPLHADLVSWVSAQVDLLYGTAFLSTIFFYFKLRMLREKGYLPLTLAAFTVAMLMKSSGFFLPLIVLLSELLLFGDQDKRPIAQRLMAPGMMFMLLGLIVTVGMVAPFLFPTPALADMLQGWGEIITSGDIWFVLFLPAFSMDDAAKNTLLVCYGTIAIALLFRIFCRSKSLKIFLWLISFALLSIAPDPALSSERFAISRLLLVPSAAACLLIVFAALPAIDDLSKVRIRWLALFGMIPLTVVSVIFAMSYYRALQGWDAAASHLRIIVEKLQQVSMSLTPEKEIVLVNLPADVGSAQDINSAVRTPFQRFGLRNRLLIQTSKRVGNQSYMWTENFKQILSSKNVGTVLAWNDQNNRLIPWVMPTGSQRLTVRFNRQTYPTFTIDPPSLRAAGLTGTETLEKVGSKITPLADGLRIYPGRNTVTIWAPNQTIDPMSAGVAGLILEYTSQTGCKTCHSGAMSLVWEGDLASHGATRKTTGRAAITNNSFGQYIVWLARYPQWSLAKNISRIGVQFAPGEYYADIKSLDLIPYTWTAPRLALQSNSQLVSTGGDPVQVKANTNAAILFDAKSVPDARGVKVIVTTGDASLEPSKEEDLYSFLPAEADSPLVNGDFANISSGVELPKKILSSAGTYQARADLPEQRRRNDGFAKRATAL